MLADHRRITEAALSPRLPSEQSASDQHYGKSSVGMCLTSASALLLVLWPFYTLEFIDTAICGLIPTHLVA